MRTEGRADALIHSASLGGTGRSFFFFFLIHYSRASNEIMARWCTGRFLSTVRAVAARFKHPFAIRPGLSPEDVVRTK